MLSRCLERESRLQDERKEQNESYQHHQSDSDGMSIYPCIYSYSEDLFTLSSIRRRLQASLVCGGHQIPSAGGAIAIVC